jgi:hypothetical protein
MQFANLTSCRQHDLDFPHHWAALVVQLAHKAAARQFLDHRWSTLPVCHSHHVGIISLCGTRSITLTSVRLESALPYTTASITYIVVYSLSDAAEGLFPIMLQIGVSGMAVHVIDPTHVIIAISGPVSLAHSVAGSHRHSNHRDGHNRPSHSRQRASHRPKISRGYRLVGKRRRRYPQGYERVRYPEARDSGGHSGHHTQRCMTM